MVVVSTGDVLFVAVTLASQGGSRVALAQPFINLLILVDFDGFIPGDRDDSVITVSVAKEGDFSSVLRVTFELMRH